jgi:hypothetical protein
VTHPVFLSPKGLGPGREGREIDRLKKEARDGDRRALESLWKIGFNVITIGGRQINLRERFGDRR